MYTATWALHKKVLQLKINPGINLSDFFWLSPFALLWLSEKHRIYSNMNFKVMIPTLIGQIMMQYLGFISFLKALLSHYKISFRKTGSVLF